MNHVFHKGSDQTRPTIILLHGTGGNEHDLVSIGKTVDPKANLLGIRGNVSENGMPRFFRRLAEGVFDQEDLIARTHELYEFINEAAEKYDFNRDNITALGYSNGANIAASLLFHYENAFNTAILHHPMVPLRDIELPNLKGKNIFIGAGTNDPICPAAESEELDKLLATAGAEVTLHWENNGHQLTFQEVNVAKDWYEKL